MLKSHDSQQIVSRVLRVPTGDGSKLRSRRNSKTQLSARASETLLAERKIFLFHPAVYCRHSDWFQHRLCAVSGPNFGQRRYSFRNPGNDLESRSNRKLVHTDVKSEFFRFWCGCSVYSLCFIDITGCDDRSECACWRIHNYGFGCGWEEQCPFVFDPAWKNGERIRIGNCNREESDAWIILLRSVPDVGERRLRVRD